MNPIKEFEDKVRELLLSKNKSEYEQIVEIKFEGDSYGGSLSIEFIRAYSFSPRLNCSYKGCDGKNMLKLQLQAFPHCCGIGILHNYHCADKVKGFNEVIKLVEKFARNFMEFGKLILATNTESPYLEYFKDYKQIDDTWENPKSKNTLVMMSKTL